MSSVTVNLDLVPEHLLYIARDMVHDGTLVKLEKRGSSYLAWSLANGRTLLVPTHEAGEIPMELQDHRKRHEEKKVQGHGDRHEEKEPIKATPPPIGRQGVPRGDLPDLEGFGGALRRSRMEAQLTQEALAELVGTFQTDVSSWEIGKRIPQPKQLATLRGLGWKLPDPDPVAVKYEPASHRPRRAADKPVPETKVEAAPEAKVRIDFEPAPEAKVEPAPEVKPAPEGESFEAALGLFERLYKEALKGRDALAAANQRVTELEAELKDERALRLAILDTVEKLKR